MKDFLGNELKVGDKVVIVDAGECFDIDIVKYIDTEQSTVLLEGVPGTFYRTLVIKVIKE